MSSPTTNSDNLFRVLKLGLNLHIQDQSIKSIPYSICRVKSKSLGCYMVKPHGQLVLVS